MLDLVTLSRAPEATLRLSALAQADDAVSCACCDAAPAEGCVAGMPLCLTCQPCFALDEPDIDSLVSLIWLPHLDQGMLSRLVAAMHAAAARQGVTVHQSHLDGPALRARTTFASLRALGTNALSRIGTTRVSELRSATRDLSNDQLVGRKGETGLRLLFNGNWFVPQPDRYFDAMRDRARSAR